MSFEPELGQALLTNTPWQDLELSDSVRNVIVVIGSMLKDYGFVVESPVSNVGEWYENDTFTIRAYCWCDGDRHPDGCPPNFTWRDLSVAWYKHIDRGSSMNRDLSPRELSEMLQECVASVEADEPCDHMYLTLKTPQWPRTVCVRCNK